MSDIVPRSASYDAAQDEAEIAVLGRAFEDRKRAEEELKKQTAHLDELFELAPHAVVLVDAEVRVIRVNKEFTHMFGYTQGESVNQPLLDLVAPEERLPEYQNNARMLSSGQKVESETIRKRKDGVRIHVSMTASPVLTAGPIEGYIIYRDITERKRRRGAARRRETAPRDDRQGRFAPPAPRSLVPTGGRDRHGFPVLDLVGGSERQATEGRRSPQSSTRLHPSARWEGDCPGHRSVRKRITLEGTRHRLGFPHG